MSKAYERLTDFLKGENIEFFAATRAENLPLLPGKALPEKTKSAIVFLMPYYTGIHKSRNVALYAVSRDYHLFAKHLNENLDALYGESHLWHRIFADASPVDERRAALILGLGVLGENGLVINQKYGVYVFIGVLLTEEEFDEDEYKPILEIFHCKKCGKCKELCAYLRGQSDICFSELTQKKLLSESELSLVKSRKIRWGCDGCAEACNEVTPKVTPIEFFHKDILENITPEMIQSMSKQEFSLRAYSWRGKKIILRNLER